MTSELQPQRPSYPQLLLLLLIVAVEFFMFRSYVSENVAPYYPRMWDQVATYHHVYQAHYLWRDHGLAAAFGPGSPIADLAFKSTLVPTAGTVFTFLFGPERLSVGLVNFFIFIGAQALVTYTLFRTKGVSCSIIGWGLLLLSQSHWINGLFDLRFDYAGMLAFGASWVTLAGYLANPARRPLLCFLGALILCALTRSITLVYTTGTCAAVAAFLLIPTLLSQHKPIWKQRLIAAATASLVSLATLATFTLTQWFSLRSYYGSLVGTDIGTIRWAEVGVTRLQDRLTWYPINCWPHFGQIVITSLAVIATCVVVKLGKRIWRKSTGAAIARSPDYPWSLSWFLLLAAILAIFASSVIHGPNIAVIGMLTIPLAMTSALILDQVMAGLEMGFLRRGLVCLLALLGAADWSNGIIRGREINAPWRERGEVGQAVMEALALNVEARENPHVLFLWTHDIYNPLAFQTYQMETRHKLPPPARYSLSDLQTMSSAWFSSSISQATCVVGYLKPPELAPGQYEWPALTSIRQKQSEWEPMLARDFILAGRWQQPSENAVIGLWVRKISFGRIRFPDLATPEGVPAFWVSPEPMPMELINATAGDLPVELHAPAWPGPGREETAQIILTARLEGQEPVKVRLSPETQFDLRIRLVLKPGKNVVWLSAQDAVETTPAPHHGRSVFLPVLTLQTPAPEPGGAQPAN